MIEQLIGRVFYTRNLAHWQHWQTKSFAQHEALGAFYTDVIEALDAVVESYQGAFEIVGAIPAAPTNDGDIAKHLAAEAGWIEQNHDKICKSNRAVANLLDTLSDVYLRAVYKLTNLK